MAYRKAFTIVELLVVIVVIGILAIISLVSYNSVANKATIASLSSDLNSASKQLRMFSIVNNTYPLSISDCPTPAAGSLCLKSSDGTNYSYRTISSQQAFCLSVTKSNISYNITQDNQALPGLCPVLDLNPGNNLSYPGTGASWYDMSGNGNTATITGATYQVTEGVFSFDGVNDSVNVGNNLEWSGALTVASWHKRTTKDVTNADGIVGNWHWAASVNDRRGWIQRYYINTDSLAFIAEYTNGSSITEIQTTCTTSLNNWYYTVSVFNPSDRTSKLYVNGSLCGTTGIPVGYEQIAYDSPNPVWIGYSSVNSGYFPGSVGGVRIYNSVLSVSDILQNYNATKGRYGL